jgi:tetratricopeptide (TPR) repeat protein
LKRAADIRKKVLGERHAAVADCLYNIAIIHKQLNRFEPAKRYLEECRQIRVDYFKEKSLQVAECDELLGKIALNEERLKDAYIHLKDCYRTRHELSTQQHTKQNSRQGHRNTDLTRVGLLIV